MHIVKAVIPAAGYGTRFLPFTKAVPKEMLPLLNKPAIQYIVEEIMAANLQQCAIITTKQKQAIKDHFSPNPPLEKFLKQHNKLGLLQSVQKIIDSIDFTYINQEEALGLGHAVSLAHHVIGNEYFAVLLPDDIILHSSSAIGQLITIAREKNAAVLAVQEMPAATLSSYGVIAIEEQLSPELFAIQSVVEKPAPNMAPSNFAIIGRYILPPVIFKALQEIKPSNNGELQLTDALAWLLEHGHPIFAYKIQGNRYDVGTPAGWLSAIHDLSQTK